jgi:hypothetical protein
MKRLPRLQGAVCAAALLALSLPTHAWAQASGAGQSPGVVRSTQLPRTGNPDADTANPTFPVVIIAGGALLTALVLGKRQRDARKRQ